MRADTSAHQDSARCLLCYIFLPSYHFTDGWRRGWCDKALYPSGHALFSLTLISRGHRSTTPKWCVGVCSGPARVWVTGLAHPHRHDTAQNNRLTRLPAEAAWIVWPALCVCSRRVFCTCVGGWECVGKKNVLSTLLSYVRSHVCNAALGYFFRSQYCLCCVSPRLPRLFVCLLDERITGAVGNRRMIFWLYV